MGRRSGLRAASDGHIHNVSTREIEEYPIETLTLTEAAALAQCGSEHMRFLAKSRKVPATKIGRRWVFPRHLLEQWIEQRCHFTSGPAQISGGSRSQSLASRMRAQREQKIAAKAQNVSDAIVNDSSAAGKTQTRNT